MKNLWITTTIIAGALIFAGCTDEEIVNSLADADDGSSVISPIQNLDAQNSLAGHKISASGKVSLVKYKVSVEFKCNHTFTQITQVSSVLSTSEKESMSGDKIDFTGSEDNRRMNFQGTDDHNDSKTSKNYITLNTNDRIVIGESYMDVLKINKIEQVIDCTKMQ
ncbi:MAG: hypothetical protein KAG56_06085 [Sulfurovaceae bacterium]|nr:hypothetical protein [Sulfurovaceae bacterium]